jgi:mono/diheme cytochrome c family protein
MTTHAQRTLRLRKILFALLLALICVAILMAVHENKQWNIPEEDKRRVNPIQPSREVINAARGIYLDKCSQCHGTLGKGDGPDAATYYPSPTNLTDASHINSVTDGEIFYQISQGRKPMPAFKKRLTEEQRWQLVLFVRAFAAHEPSNR